MNLKFTIAIVLGMSLIGCSEVHTSRVSPAASPVEPQVDIPDTTVLSSELFYDTKTSRWTLAGQLFSGYAVTFYEDHAVKEKFGVLQGRKQNLAIRYYPDGRPKHMANYHQGKLHGDKKTWLSDSSHTLIAQLSYVGGKLHGEQKKWYPTGQLYQKLQYNKGKEDGLQQAFRKNGALYANYEARDGRIFGLKKATLCYGLESENISYPE